MHGTTATLGQLVDRLTTLEYELGRDTPVWFISKGETRPVIIAKIEAGGGWAPGTREGDIVMDVGFGARSRDAVASFVCAERSDTGQGTSPGGPGAAAGARPARGRAPPTRPVAVSKPSR